MKTRSCPRGGGLRLSEIGLGAWPLGGRTRVGDEVIGRGDVSEDEAIATILAAVDSGVMFFDTSDIYGMGRSEERLGRALTGKWDTSVVATKVGKVVRPDNTIGTCFDPPYIQRAADASLRRLRKDALDIYLLHNASPVVVADGGVVSCMERLKEQGKIRRWGVSARDVNEAVEMLEGGFPGDFLEVVFNLLRQETALRCFPLAHRAGVGIIVRVPLEYGVLTGRFLRGTRFSSDDHRHYTLEPRLEAELVRLEALRVALGTEGENMTLAALRFCLGFHEVTSIVTGARVPAQIRMNATASCIGPLPPGTIAEVRSLYERGGGAPLAGIGGGPTLT